MKGKGKIHLTDAQREITKCNLKLRAGYKVWNNPKGRKWKPEVLCKLCFSMK